MRQTNQKLLFNCSVCGTEAKAIVNTERAEKKLCKDCFGKRKDERKNQLNDLSGREWALLSKSIEKYNGFRSEKQKIHGAAFPLSLVKDHIKIYTKIGQVVLDPFLGVGTTSQAAQSLDRKSIGIELNSEFVELAARDVNCEDHQIICDDARNMKNHIEPNSIDFLITSPPYANLLKKVKGNFAFKWREHSELNTVPNPKPYSSDNRDLGNLEYHEFLIQIGKIFSLSYEVLKDNSYCVWIVKDYRDLENGIPYVNFHSDIIKCAESAEFKLWDIRIYDQTEFRPLVVLGYPSRNYYLNIGHSYILIFKKENRKNTNGKNKNSSGVR